MIQLHISSQIWLEISHVCFVQDIDCPVYQMEPASNSFLNILPFQSLIYFQKSKLHLCPKETHLVLAHDQSESSAQTDYWYSLQQLFLVDRWLWEHCQFCSHMAVL